MGSALGGPDQAGPLVRALQATTATVVTVEYTKIIVSALTAGALALLIAAWWRFYDIPQRGWDLTMIRNRKPDEEGRRDIQVTARLIGKMVIYEANLTIWGDPDHRVRWLETDGFRARMDCDTTQLSAKFSIPADLEANLYYGVEWIAAKRFSIVGHADRASMVGDDYERWKWKVLRNPLRRGSPQGSWHEVGEVEARRSFKVPGGFPAGPLP